MDVFIQVIEILIKNLSSILAALAGIWVAVVATLALRTWKYQTRAEKHIQFMDELTDTVHEYIQAMQAPIEALKYIEIAIEGHSEVASVQYKENKYGGIISYIAKDGKADQTRLFEYLDKVRPIMSRMLSMATKGQVMGFNNYRQCHDACTMLAWSYDQIGAIAMLIGNPHHNWANEQVQKTFDDVMTIKSCSIKENIEKHNGIFLEFIKQNYQILLS